MSSDASALALLLSRYARHVEFIGEPLLDVKQVGIFGSQIIHLAAFSNDAQDLERCIRYGADVNVMGDLDMVPLHYAVLGGAIDTVQLLLIHGTNSELENEFGETPCQMSGLMGETSICELLSRSNAGQSYGSDNNLTARNRWLEFREIQRKNFWRE